MIFPDDECAGVRRGNAHHTHCAEAHFEIILSPARQMTGCTVRSGGRSRTFSMWRENWIYQHCACVILHQKEPTIKSRHRALSVYHS
jgi:hypothetical protein